MSNAARKARKRAGIKFVKAAKVGTPLLERVWFAQPVLGPVGTKLSIYSAPRSAKKVKRALDARTVQAAI